MNATSAIHSFDMHNISMVVTVELLDDGDISIAAVHVGGQDVMPVLSKTVLDCAYNEIYYRVNS